MVNLEDMQRQMRERNAGTQKKAPQNPGSDGAVSEASSSKAVLRDRIAELEKRVLQLEKENKELRSQQGSRSNQAYDFLRYSNARKRW